ncbi:MAG TPA: Gfo/Idh/MocA family oxidoreductase [Flavisolibacter sp.]|jgi:predicted dehydrogenase|nr:Gfo/Idh/MocA family oxidoreductase [Flavisolibacter sp.]
MRKLRMGMIGGGPGAFIGAVHRTAATMDGLIELVCGAFSSNPEKSKSMAAELALPEGRVYGTWEEMIEKEKALPADQRMEIVSIVTPNHVHFAPAKAAMEAGFDVVMDKPMTFDLAEAKELQKVVAATGRLFCLTHTYTGYPMVKEAREQVRNGRIGKVRKIFVTYPQGWLSQFKEGTGDKQATWRTDPTRSGAAGAMGDIGTHAFNLTEYVTDLQVTALCAQLNIVVEGRKLDDDGAVLLQYNNGATGVLMASQIMAGEENNLTIKVYGEKGGLMWRHADPNSLDLRLLDQPYQTLRAGNDYLSPIARHNTRTPWGHPEGFFEAFANHYRNFALCVTARDEGKEPAPEWTDFPGIEDGVRGMAFIENVLRSGQSEVKWTEFTV